MLNLIRGCELERARLRRVIGWTMAAAGAACILGLAIALALWPVEGRAQAVPLYVHEQPEVTVRLMPGPCVDSVSKILIAINMPSTGDQWRAIESTWLMRDGSRQDFAGCWLAAGDDFLLIFSDRTGARVPKLEFGKRRGQVGA